MNIIYLLALITRQEREQDYLKQAFLYLLHDFASLLCTSFFFVHGRVKQL